MSIKGETGVDQSKIFDPGNKFWDDVENKLKASGRIEHYHGPDLIRDLEGEVAFGNRVFSSVKEAVDSGGKRVHLLFDIDNTIGAYSMDYEDIKDRKFIIRPVFIEVLSELKKSCEEKGVALDVGFISNRGAAHMLEQLNSGGQFESFASYVNKDLVLSSRLENAWDLMDDHGDHLDYIKQFSVVDKSSPELNRYREINPDGVDKLTVLERLKNKMQTDERCVVVDDSPVYPDILDKKSGMYGVNVREKSYYSRA